MHCQTILEIAVPRIIHPFRIVSFRFIIILFSTCTHTKRLKISFANLIEFFKYFEVSYYNMCSFSAKILFRLECLLNDKLIRHHVILLRYVTVSLHSIVFIVVNGNRFCFWWQAEMFWTVINIFNNIQVRTVGEDWLKVVFL